MPEAPTHPRAAATLSWLRAAGMMLLDLFFPPRCGGCGAIGTLLCADCRAKIVPFQSPVCRRCGQPWAGSSLCPECRHTPSALDGISASGVFTGPLREAIHNLKYHGVRDLASPLGAIMAACWNRDGLAADVIVPVPLHSSRQAERGYNQSALLARELGAAVGIFVDERVLVRHRATLPQVDLGWLERRRNVGAAFSCKRAVSGQRVALVDDVCTTGATLEACAETLKAAGAANVWGFTLARARWGQDRAGAPDTVSPSSAVDFPRTGN